MAPIDSPRVAPATPHPAGRPLITGGAAAALAGRLPSGVLPPGTARGRRLSPQAATQAAPAPGTARR